VTPQPLRWGVLGATSYVARLAVLPALRDSPHAVLQAVASRSAIDAQRIAVRFGAARAYGSYDEVLADADVDAVYIPLPNVLHREWTLRCAAAGKHVLCEKPLGVDAAQAQEMARACAQAGVVLMEAYMTPFHPRAAALLEIAGGELGTLVSARSVFSFPLRDPGNHRWLAGGGALLDVGIYCLSPLLAIAGRDPLRIAAAMRPAPSGVDASATGWLDFGEGFAAGFECSFEAPERQLLEVTGTEASLSAERIFTGGPEDVELRLRRRDGGEELRRTEGLDPYRAMVEHFAGVAAGTAPLHDVSEAVRMARLLDAVRLAARTD
jgi:predicted dehydrogenase